MFSTLVIQDGPVSENGVNGDQVDDIIEACANLLRSYNQPPYSNRDTSLAITHLEDAWLRLQHRAAERVKRGVEGTSQP